MIIMMVVIFLFSCMQGDDSSETSGVFLNALVKIGKAISHKNFSSSTMASLHLIIRKLAHVTEYTMLGGCAGFYKKDY